MDGLNRPSNSLPGAMREGWLFKRYGMLVGLVYLVCALLFLSLGIFETLRIRHNSEAVALERGRGFFALIELTRDWNAHHGGVYVPVTEETPPNPYLAHPRRDLQLSDGTALTMVNPAYMTRQLAELAEQSTDVRFHITSLKPLRPPNAADDWEAETLRLFEQGVLRERVAFVGDYHFNGYARPVHRYMAPLLVKAPCLQCHAQQGYQVGDIRGGISVTMPADNLLAAHEQSVKSSLLILLAGFVVTTALMHLLASRARRHYLQLHGLVESQEHIIIERTRALEERNDDLHREVDERRRREHELRLAGAVFESAAEAIMVTDAANRIVRVNPAFTAITGYTAEEVLGRDPELLRSGRHAPAFYAEMWAALAAQGRWEGEIYNRHKNGDVYVVWLSIVRIADEDGDQGHHLAVFHDITRRKEAEEQLRHRAYHDVLTELPNRVLFYDRLQAALNQAKRYQRSIALLMVDLDRFKEVNDSLGHPAGDELLVETARRLVSCVRESDTVARLGGDEFAIIITDMTQAAEAEQVAQRAVELLAAPYHLDAGTVSISGCIGIALYPQHGQDGEQLQYSADHALYAAKTAGRNGYRIYAPTAHGGGQRELL